MRYFVNNFEPQVLFDFIFEQYGTKWTEKLFLYGRFSEIYYWINCGEFDASWGNLTLGNVIQETVKKTS